VRFRTVSRELMVTLDVGLFIRVNGQKGSPLSAPNRSKIIAVERGFQRAIVIPEDGPPWMPITAEWEGEKGKEKKERSEARADARTSNKTSA